MKGMEKYMVPIILFVFVIFLTACGNNDYIVKVNGDVVTKREFDLYLEIGKIAFEKAGGGEDIWQTPFDGEKAEDVFKKKLMDDIIKIKIQDQMAKSKGITPTKDEIEQMAKVEEQFISTMNSKKQFAKDILDKFARETIVASKLFNEETKNVETTDSAFEEYVKTKGNVDVNTLADEDRRKLKAEYEYEVKKEVYDKKLEEWKTGAKVEINEAEIKKIQIVQDNQ